MNILVTQILGNSDVSIGGEKAADILKKYSCSSEEDLEYCRQEIEQETSENFSRVNFPLIQLLNSSIQKKYSDDKITFCIILTNQRKWIKERHQDNPDIWREFAASDGIIWLNILGCWCQENNIDYITLELELDGSVPLGVSNWENISPLITELLNDQFISKNNNLHNKTSNQSIDQIIIQHSSGTPALCSALYLWGIEKRLDRKNIDFVYISRESVNFGSDSCCFHNGSHWQWRLLVPQISELLELQDFFGAQELVSESVFSNAKSLKKDLRKLDRIVSFNLIDIKENLSLDEQVIERIAIALWSEKGFRERGQWMQWILRMTGAFELTCNHYLAMQDNWFWQEKRVGISIWHKDILENANFFIPISLLVKQLLDNGEFNARYTLNSQEKYLTVKCQSIRHQKWRDFTYFYCDHGWRISNQYNLSFSQVRNDLYHNLMGDKLDQILDSKTDEFKSNGGAFNENHPAQIAVQRLRDLLEITNLWDEVDQRVKGYQSQVKSVKEALLK
jgi:hypothetical protein